MEPPKGANDWFRIDNSTDDPDSTDVYVYGSIGGFWGIYADEFIEELQQVTAPNINLRLNSGGGSVFEGVAVANAIRAHPANFTVYVDSLAASIASVIMLAGDKIVFMPQAQCMIHNASGLCAGEASDMTKMADLLDRQTRNIADAYAQRTGRPVAEFLDLMDQETWFSAQEALDIGLADELYTPSKKTTETPAEARMQATWDLSMYRYPGRDLAPAPKVTVELDGKDVTEHLKPGQILTADAIFNLMQTVGAQADKPSTDPVIVFGNKTYTSSEFADLLRDMVRKEVANVFDSTAPSHSTAVQDGTWDAGANEKRLPSPVPLATVKKMYTYWDEGQAKDGKVPKTACKLPHHFVSEDGTPGAASVSGVRNALARLPQTQGLSDAERSAAEAHLRGHLNAFKGDEEDHADTDPADQMQPDDSPAAQGPPAEDASPFPPPDKEEEEEEEEEDEDEPPPDEEDEPADQADDWNSVVGLLLSPTSPSADDVFAQLKEGW